MPTTSIVFKKYLSDVFVETGSYMGHGIDYALQAGFKNIYSIELSTKYFEFCIDKYNTWEKVIKEPELVVYNKEGMFINLVRGDSGLVLYDVISKIDKRITFWLDGHYSGGDTAKGIAVSPILYELSLIKKHSIQNHIIMIDDLRDLNVPPILDRIKEINPSYRFIYEDGVIQDGVKQDYILRNDILVAVID